MALTLPLFSPPRQQSENSLTPTSDRDYVEMMLDPEAFGGTHICDLNPSADKAVIYVYLPNLCRLQV